jgi:hypothetical protein
MIIDNQIILYYVRLNLDEYSFSPYIFKDDLSFESSMFIITCWHSLITVKILYISSVYPIAE